MAAVADENSYGHNMTMWELEEMEQRERGQEEHAWVERMQDERAQEAWAEYLSSADQPEEETDWDATSDDDMDVDIIDSIK